MYVAGKKAQQRLCSISKAGGQEKCDGAYGLEKGGSKGRQDIALFAVMTRNRGNENANLRYIVLLWTGEGNAAAVVNYNYMCCLKIGQGMKGMMKAGLI